MNIFLSIFHLQCGGLLHLLVSVQQYSGCTSQHSGLFSCPYKYNLRGLDNVLMCWFYLFLQLTVVYFRRLFALKFTVDFSANVMFISCQNNNYYTFTIEVQVRHKHGCILQCQESLVNSMYTSCSVAMC